MIRLEESIIKEKQRYLDFAEMNKEKHIYIWSWKASNSDSGVV